MATIITHIIGSFLASICYAILSNVPPKELVYSGLAGMSAWLIMKGTIMLGSTDVLGTFLGAMIMGIMAYYLARARRMPATIYSIPGIFPLVPGIMIYRTFKSFFDGDSLVGLEQLMHTFVIAFAIGAGMMIVEIVQRITIRLHEK